MAGEFTAAPAVLAVRQPTRYRAETPSLGAEQDRGGGPAGDAARAGFSTRVLLDLTAGVAPDSTAKAIEDLRADGVELTGGGSSS